MYMFCISVLWVLIGTVYSSLCTVYVSAGVSQCAVQDAIHLSTRMRLSLNQTGRQSVSFSHEIFSSKCLSSGFTSTEIAALSIIHPSPFLFFHSDNTMHFLTLFHCFFSFLTVHLCGALTNSHHILLLQGMVSQMMCFSFNISSSSSLLCSCS